METNYTSFKSKKKSREEKHEFHVEAKYIYEELTKNIQNQITNPTVELLYCLDVIVKNEKKYKHKS